MNATIYAPCEHVDNACEIKFKIYFLLETYYECHNVFIVI